MLWSLTGEDQTVRVWDLASGSLLRDLHGHTDFVYSLAFSNESALLASGSSSQLNIVVYRIAYRQSLWLAGMWHATGLQATGAELRSFISGIDVHAISNLAIGFPLFWN